MWCLCGPGRCFKVCKLSKPAVGQRCAASSLWRSSGFPSGVSRLFNQCHERVLCFCSLPPKSWSHPVTIEQMPQCQKRRGATQAWDEVRGSRLALLHHTNPRSNYIYAEVTHKTPSFIQTVYLYFMQKQKLSNFLSADRGGWPFNQIICNNSKSFFAIFCGFWPRKEKEDCCICSETGKVFSIEEKKREEEKLDQPTISNTTAPRKPSNSKNHYPTTPPPKKEKSLRHIKEKHLSLQGPSSHVTLNRFMLTKCQISPEELLQN